MKDSRARKVKQELKKTGVRPSKKRGQNFLIDPGFVNEILSFGAPDFNLPIVEIGPGLGALTKELSGAADLTLIEIENEFCSELVRKYPHAKIINKDVREVNLSELGKELLIFGNLPYVYSTDIIFCLIEHRTSIKRAVLLLQQEFSERLAAGPGTKAFGILSIAAQMWADIRLGPVIKGDAFVPPTKVNSRLIELKFLPKARYDAGDQIFFKKVVKAAFSQRRKKIINSMSSSGVFTKEMLEKAMHKCAIDPQRRAETLSIEEFVRLSRALG